jgi:large subunit ribosomal protein L25
MLEGISRDKVGKTDAKKLRNEGYLIANIYGGDLKENVYSAFKKNDFIRYVKNKDTFAFDVKVGDATYNVTIVEYQKDPVTYDLKHVDLIATSSKKQFYMLPIRIKGVAKGVKNKGLLTIHRSRLKVKAVISDLPSFLEIDVTDLDVGDNVLVKDINLKNANIFLNSTIPLVGVIKAK